MELQGIQKFHVIGNKVCSPLLFVLLLLSAHVFTLLAFDVFMLLCFTGNDSWKGFDDSAIFSLLDIIMCNNN